jgi:NAD(P) transhydrogenase subunit alpha
MLIGLLKETYPGERRVALTPSASSSVIENGHTVHVETGSGILAGYPDEEYASAGCEICSSSGDVMSKSNVYAVVHAPTTHPDKLGGFLGALSEGDTVIGFADPMATPIAVQAFAETGATLFAMELMPRITRAQSMDALSSMATVSGYKIVLDVADRLPRMFPLMMTAAGTVAAAKVLVIGAGVAGLQAIATARRLGAIVRAYDVRPAVQEQVESLGAEFVELDVKAEAVEDAGGYAAVQGEDFYRRQQAALAEVVSSQDVVITTALIPGKPAPVLLTADMVRRMSPGSIVADLAAERGGNCELTEPGEEVCVNGVLVLGPTNIPSSVPYHASQMYARNWITFWNHLTDETGNPVMDTADEITRETLVTRDGEVVNERVKDAWKEAEGA